MEESRGRKPAAVPSLKARSPTPNGRTRVDLAACYRLVALYGWDDLVFTHISARVPGPRAPLSDQPLRHAVRGGDRLEPRQGRPRRRARSRRARSTSIRRASSSTRPIHAAREDAQCVLHLHTPAGVAVSCAEGGAPADLAAVDVRARQSRLPRLRGRRAERRREAAPRRRPRRGTRSSSCATTAC